MAGWNLGLRFGLEVAALVGFGVAGWKLADGVWGWVAAIGGPVVAAVVWATFNVPGDPSRSGEAPVAVPGALRLALELAVLIGGAAALFLRVDRVIGLGVATLVVFHYTMSMSRVAWLLGHE